MFILFEAPIDKLTGMRLAIIAEDFLALMRKSSCNSLMSVELKFSGQ